MLMLSFSMSDKNMLVEILQGVSCKLAFGAFEIFEILAVILSNMS